jgi:two-component system NtrC family sensor kinase
VLDLLRSKIKAREATLDVQCDRNLDITAVHGELRQVFSNLVANSLDALGEDGRVCCAHAHSASPTLPNR